MKLRTQKIAGCAALVTLFACGDRTANKLKSQKTMADIRILANTLERYSVDNSLYPPSGDLDRLAADLTPTYGTSIPRLDAWGQSFRVEISETRKDYRITSSGADGVFENRPRLATRAGARPKPEPGMGPSADTGTDLVYENGIFIRWWDGLPAATAPGSQGLFVQIPPAK